MYVCSPMTPTPTVDITPIPRPGMLATVRNRRGTVTAVDPFDGEAGRLHLVHLDYQDGGSPSTQRLLWELEPRTTLLEPIALPNAYDTDPMPGRDFDALLRAARWTALSPYLGLDGSGRRRRSTNQSPAPSTAAFASRTSSSSRS